MPLPYPDPHSDKNAHWCRLDLLPDDTVYRSVCACGWSSSWTQTAVQATEAGLVHTTEQARFHARYR
jgi:hypothetical protein